MYWTLHTDGGPRKVNHAAVCVGDKIFSFGGYSEFDEYTLWDPISVHVLDTTVFKWALVESRHLLEEPFQRYGHTCVAHGDKIYLWGGRNVREHCETLYCFDTVKLQWTTPSVTGSVPNGTDGHSACIVNNKMYVFGGFDYITNQHTSNLYSLDLHTMKWCFVETKGEQPSARDFHTALAYGNRMYIYGGRSERRIHNTKHIDFYCDKVYYFDTVTEYWVEVVSSGITPVGRRSHSSWVHNGFMYVFGGYNGKIKRHFNHIHRFSFERNHWEYTKVYGTPPCERRRQVCLLYNDKVYLFGGTSPIDQVIDDNEDNEFEDDDNVMDKDDLHILEYLPSLKVLSLNHVLKYKMDTSSLPKDLLLDIKIRTEPNKI